MHRTLRLPTLFVAVAGLGAAACTATEDSIADEDEVVSALELDNGGLTMDDEAPQFGAEPDFDLAAIEGDAAVDDPLAATMADLSEAVGAERIRVVIAWGQLPIDMNEDEARDWSGTLELSRGGMVVRRRIGFEAATDRLEPRTDRTRVDFRSITRPFADGLVLDIYDADPTNTAPLVLRYRGAAGDYAFDLREARGRNLVRDVDARGNRIIVTALRRPAADRDPCAHGFMRGRWHQIRPGLGAYLGVVANADGEPVGHVRGIYGVRRNGAHVLFGKFINREGQFTGLIAGHYRDGEFVARWLAREGEAGRIHGLYRESLPGDRVGGAWVARWAETTCAQDLPVDGP